MSSTNKGVPSPRNFAPSPDFKWLCDELFVRIDKAQRETGSQDAFRSTNTKYFEVISFFVKLWRKTVGEDIFPALVLVLPYRDRRIFNIKDFTLIKAICIYLKLPKNSSTEKRLLRWKRRAGRGVRLSDFCVEEIKKRKPEPLNRERITVDKLNKCLDQLAEERSTMGRGFKGLSESLSFNYCLGNMTSTELKYYFDIILKARVIGGQEHKFLNCWHPDARDYLSVVSDLKTVAERLWDPRSRLRSDDLNINVGFAFAPSLARRLHVSYDKVSIRLKKDFYIEEKMDGERNQLHFMNYGERLKWFSRRGNDYTYLYGENVHSGTVAQYIQMNPKVKNCVLDGEMISYDTSTNTILPFGLVKNSARDALTIDSISTKGYRPLYMVFDLLYLNGVSLIKVPLHIRKQYLSSILKPCPHAVEIIPSVHCFDEVSIRNSLQKAIAMGSEGIILKQFKSKYEIGARTDKWIKIKPEYLEQFGENLDLIVIGRTPAKKDSLMCGLLVLKGEEEPINEIEEKTISLDSEDDEEPRKAVEKIISFCTIANGISQEEFREIDRKTVGRWKKTEDSPPPKLLEFGSKLPEEWIHPADSVILEIKARSLDNTESSSRKFRAGCTLYGAYCRKIRDDKNWMECYTFSDLCQERRKKSPAFEKATTQKLLKSKRSGKTRTRSTLNQTLKCTDESKTSDILSQLCFYVMSDYVSANDNYRITKEGLCNMILRNGGKLIYNVISQDRSNLRIISGRYTIECKALIELGYDVINPKWILDCIRNGAIIKIEPRHCFSVSEDLKIVAGTRVDPLGDSYEAEIDEDRLGEILTSEKVYSEQPIQRSDDYYKFEGIPLFLFSKRAVFIPDNFPYIASKTLKHKIKLYGGELAPNINACNVIVVPNCDEALRKQTLSDIRIFLSSFAVKTELPPSIPRIVTPQWIDQSIEKNCQLPEEDFLAI